MTTDIYNDYHDQKFEYCYPNFDFYRGTKRIPKYEWDYEDTITFNFNLRECGCSNDSGSLDTKKAILEFYNWRGEVVASKSYNLNELNSETLTISYTIDSYQSKKIFVRGLYTIRIQISDLDEVELKDREVTTVLQPNKILMKVK